MNIGDKIMHVADGVFYNMDDYKTKRNNNMMVFGASGTSKTRSIVIPNILQATGSYIISDPKGNLYNNYKDHLIKNGYKVYNINLKETNKSNSYNPFAYIKSEQDILKVASILVESCYINGSNNRTDFFKNAGKYLLASIIAYVKYQMPIVRHNFATVAEILSTKIIKDVDVDVEIKAYLLTLKNGDGENIYSCMDEEHKINVHNLKTWNVNLKTYFNYLNNNKSTVASRLFSICSSDCAKETIDCIFMEAINAVNLFNMENIKMLTSRSDFNFETLATHKTALFISCSDTDRSLDALCSLIYTQILQVLCDYADIECKNSRLPIDVRFILDDFATNYRIEDFDKSIAMIRSRGISATIITQDYNQLVHGYGVAGKTICNNCDTWIFLGANDYDTADIMAKQVKVNAETLMDMKIGDCYIYRRAEKVKHTKLIKLERFKNDIKCHKEIIKKYEPIKEKTKQIGFHI